MWKVEGNDELYWPGSEGRKAKKLPVAIYKLKFSLVGPYLHRISDKFEFPYKVYGMETKFIKRVSKAWEHTTTNLGILLNGIKGTGKTVTAKQIANEIDLPVIIVDGGGSGAASFIAEMDQDCIFFFDEYEKTFQGTKDEEGNRTSDDNSMLAVMDGAVSGNARKLFILTTNNKWVNENLMDRPSRVRYIKEFTHLSKEVVQEIVEDIIDNKSYVLDAVEYISSLSNITVDIVKAIVHEINMMDETPEEFKDVFNAEQLGKSVDVYTFDKEGKEVLYLWNAELNYFPINRRHIGNNLHDHKSNTFIGLINKVSEDGKTVEAKPITWTEDGKREFGTPLKFTLRPVSARHSAYSRDAEYTYGYGEGSDF